MPFGPIGGPTGAYYVLCRARQWNLPKVAAFRKWIRTETETWLAENRVDRGRGPRPAAIESMVRYG